jgi:hypothetical protein
LPSELCFARLIGFLFGDPRQRNDASSAALSVKDICILYCPFGD